MTSVGCESKQLIVSLVYLHTQQVILSMQYELSESYLYQYICLFNVYMYMVCILNCMQRYKFSDDLSLCTGHV